MDGLTEGRIVHYVFNDMHCAAVITRVWSGNDTVNLHVFKDGSYPEVPETPTSVVFNDDVKPNHTWHWIEKA